MVFTNQPFVSYAQNFEDVILWRSLSRVENGFYIDIGAQHPINDSVTCAFYERGWSGINIEPHKNFLDLLQQSRSRDLNLGCLVGAKSGSINFDLAMDGSGLSTSKQEFADNLRISSIPVVEEIIGVRTLSEIWEQHVRNEVHFLKIDVEGMESEVIQGADFRRFRPWIVLVESFKPNSCIENHDEWEESLFEHRYEMVYADGLNRFYVAEEKIALKDFFKFPPNVFDNYKIHAVVDRDVRVGLLEQVVVDRDVRVGLLEQVIADQNLVIYKIHKSLSWRISYPIRALIPMTLRVLIAAKIQINNFSTKCLSKTVAPVIHGLQMRPELLRKVSGFAKKIKIYDFLLRKYIKGGEDWAALQPDKTFVMLGQIIDPEKWLRDARSVRCQLNKNSASSFRGHITRTMTTNYKDDFKDDVGVIVSLYNCKAFLPFFLESLKRQTIFSESQIYLGVVLPSENESGLIKKFRSDNSNVFVEEFSYRAGIYEVWNRGVQQTSSKFLTNMNVDDLRRDDSLELQARFLKRFDSIDVAYQDVYLSFEPNTQWELISGVGLSTALPNVSLPVMNLGFNPPHNAPMWRRRVHDDVGLFDESFKSAGDFDFWLRAFLKGIKFLKMRDIHASYYFNPEGISTLAGGASLDEIGRILAVCNQAMDTQKTSASDSRNSSNIKKYGVADGTTLDLVERLGLLSNVGNR
jgi:FkbM family methyltransferase